jgi:hypothetical protein
MEIAVAFEDTRALYDRPKVNECIWETAWRALGSLYAAQVLAEAYRELQATDVRLELKGPGPAVSPSTVGSPQTNIVFRIFLALFLSIHCKRFHAFT